LALALALAFALALALARLQKYPIRTNFTFLHAHFSVIKLDYPYSVWPQKKFGEMNIHSEL
jgi:hypothetical protein